MSVRNLAPVNFAAQPTNPTNGKVMELEGQVSAVGPSANSFALALPYAPLSDSISANNTTMFQGASDFSALTVGTFVSVDGAIQGDGSVLASRIAVQDPSTSNVSVLQGPVLLLAVSDPAGNKPATWVFGTQQQGFFSNNHEASFSMPYELSTAEFHISGALANLQNLPFVPSFNGSNMVAGQNVYITTHTTQFAGAAYLPAATVTLIPQTINGTIMASLQSANFTDYTVSLASYDLFPALAVQQGQTTLLNTPNQVEVYVDSNTQMLNSQPVSLGNTLRFYGLVFNDNGTLRMDCAQISDGVTTPSTPNAAIQMRTDVISNFALNNSGAVEHKVNTVTRSARK